MSITVENVEFYMLVLVRISGFIYTAPFFSLKNIPVKVKLGLSFFLMIITCSTIEYRPLEYSGVVGMATLIVQEAIVGVVIGYISNICSYVLSFAGQIMDQEIGFSMVTIMDPANSNQTTITSSFYTYLVLLVMLATNFHHYLLKAIFSTFQIAPIGKAIISATSLYEIILTFMRDYFVIGFRIVLPIFSSILIVNVILAVLAKVASQMNMFVVGMQLKLIVGLLILFLVISLLPSVAAFIISEMKTMIEMVLGSLSGT